MRKVIVASRGFSGSLRCYRVAIVVSFLASQSLAAQAAKVRRSAALDLAALANGEIRASVEPLVMGRSALGVSLARWWGGQNGYYPVPLSSQLVAPVGINPLHPAREYMVDVYARVYPVSFSSATPKHGVSGYLGGFVGYHRRAFDQTLYPPCILGAAIACPLAASPPGSTIPCQVPCQPVSLQTVRATSAGVEPGAELGVRVTLLGDLLIEVGGWARLITFPDPTGRFEEGQVQSRVTLAVGLGW
jgi:hypothetical protein